MTPQTYLVPIRDGRLALAVASELEDRLADEGWPALALVPAMRGVDFADPDYGGCLRAWQPGTRRYTGTPQVVALYEEGLLNRLASLGLAAYIGVPREEEWRVVHWDNDAGAMLLPVATARDLVDAVVDHTRPACSARSARASVTSSAGSAAPSSRACPRTARRKSPTLRRTRPLPMRSCRRFPLPTPRA